MNATCIWDPSVFKNRPDHSGAHPALCSMVRSNGEFSPEVEWPGRETGHFPVASTEIKNVWCYTSTSLMVQGKFLMFLRLSQVWMLWVPCFEMWRPVIRGGGRGCSDSVYDEPAVPIFRVPEIDYAYARSHGVTSRNGFVTSFRNTMCCFA
jgi:hypothetical protein